MIRVPNRVILGVVAHGDQQTVKFFEDLAAAVNNGGGGSGGSVAWGDLTGVPSTFPPSSHRLNSHSAPNGAVDFSQQQAISFRVENRTSDPASPATGQIWLRTDL